MKYFKAWIIRAINRFLLLIVATVTVMWMMFLLDMNASSNVKARHHRMRRSHTPPPPAHADNFHDFDDPGVLKFARPPDPENEAFNLPIHENKYEPANPVPPKSAEEDPGQDAQKQNEEPGLVHEPQAVKNSANAKPGGDKLVSDGGKQQRVGGAKPVGGAGKQRVDGAKPAGAGKKQPANMERPVGGDGNHPVDGPIPAQAGGHGKVADSTVLTKYTLNDLKSIPPIPFSKNTFSNCFCVNGENEQLKISADDAVMLGCPKRDDLEIRCLPRFYLAGCNNCGTTDLQYRLNKHQLIKFGSKKEPEFWTGKFAGKFDTADNLDGYTLKQYAESAKSIMDEVRNGKKNSQTVIAEMAPTLYYTMIGKWGEGGPSVPSVLKRVNPNAKFIFMLRNPIDRSLAMYNFLANPAGIPKSPDDFDKNAKLFMKWYETCTTRKKWEPRECLYGNPNSTQKVRTTRATAHDFINSIYHITLKEWIRVFGKQNILVLKFEDYMENRLEMIEKKVIPFLGIKAYTKGPLALLQQAESDKTMKYETEIKVEASEETRKTLQEFFAPHNKKLVALLGDESISWS